jgi:septal ring factor EnvC (AmiA/AmiB activator)
MKELITLSAGTAVLATTQAISEATPVNLGIVGAIVSVACGFAYWHGRKVEQNTQEMRQTNHRLQAGDRRFDALEKRVKRVTERVSNIETTCRIMHNKAHTQRIELEGDEE